MEHEPHIPDRLQADLRRVYRASIPVPGEVDGRVLAAAREVDFGKSVTRMPVRWRVIKWAGMAAAVVLALVIPTRLSQNPQSPTRTLLAGDFNRDGLIDILDAFALARAQRDGDSSITQADIDAAAAAAVRLNRGGGA
jgi:hypothetical protein